jgi:hypothetical protein
MRRWQREAAPIVTQLVQAEDVLLAARERPPVTVLACCDQLVATFDEAEEWLYAHPCPNAVYGQNFDALIRACGGIWALMWTRLHTDDDSTQVTADALTDWISNATTAREYLRESTGQIK